MPIWDSHLLGTVNDRVPQGLYVFDLFVDRELVETGRWIRNWLSHSCALAGRPRTARPQSCELAGTTTQVLAVPREPQSKAVDSSVHDNIHL